MTDEEPQDIAQTQHPDQTAALPPWSSLRRRYVLRLDDDEAMAALLPNVGEYGGEGVLRSAHHDAGEVGRTLVDRVADGRVEHFVGVLSDEVLQRTGVRM